MLFSLSFSLTVGYGRWVADGEKFSFGIRLKCSLPIGKSL
jgi:hypothetical protein